MVPIIVNKDIESMVMVALGSEGITHSVRFEGAVHGGLG